ncbi:hypothetical protein F0562_026031 [Nyssa sinensis]|uniref:Uncharacterized protein n=1 Tax=Nyssa sinensis TaxID=561372 RepID=A0A5J5B9P4_9ASTE|nr:hypothetical protein F0562_026031 [Nyssa sinensis]
MATVTVQSVKRGRGHCGDEGQRSLLKDMREMRLEHVTVYTVSTTLIIIFHSPSYSVFTRALKISFTYFHRRTQVPQPISVAEQSQILLKITVLQRSLSAVSATIAVGQRRPTMETLNASTPDFRNVGLGLAEGNAAEVEGFRCSVDDIFTKVNKLEQRVNEVEEFYLTTSKKQPNAFKGSSIMKDKGKEKHVPSIKKQQQDTSRREAAAAKRMQELMRQFGTIFRQITQHKWAWPFMHPVDVEGLGLHDYYEDGVF